MKPTKTITKTEFLKWLDKHHACEEARIWARKQKTGEDIIAKCKRGDWLVWLVISMGGQVLAEYNRIQGPALAEYERIQGQAWDEYDRIEGPALAEYQRILGQAKAEYLRIVRGQKA